MTTTTDNKAEEPTIGRLVADVSRDLSALIRGEIALAKAELKVSVKAGGMGAVLLGVAAFILLLSIVLLSIAIAHFIHMTGLDLAWCYLIVFGAYVLVALILALVGVRSLKKVGPPERAIAQAQRSKEILGKEPS